MAAKGSKALGWAALALIALAVVVWLVVRPRPRPRARLDDGATRAPSAEPTTAEPRAELGATPLAAPERIATPEIAPRALREDELEVRVVLAADRRPLAGVEVLYFDSGAVDALERERFKLWAEVDFSALVARAGRNFRSDAEGLARVPFPRGEGAVAAAWEGSWARTEIGPESEHEVVLALEPDAELSVRLTGVSGAAVAGAAVVLVTRSEHGVDLRFRRWTDGGGTARFQRLGGLRRMLSAHPRLELLACAEILAREAVSARVDANAWPSTELALALPETGRVTVELVGPDGALCEEEAEVELALARDELGRMRAAGREPPVTRLTRSSRSGSVVFEHVGLGLELGAVARADGWAEHTLHLDGPTRAGENAVARIELAQPAPVVRGRLLDARGAPLALVALDAELWSTKQRYPLRQQRRTDAQARFFGFGGAALREDAGWRILLSVAGEEGLGALRELPFPVPAGVIELGDVALELPPLLASGRVVDEAGEPVRAARVECEEEDVGNSTASWTTFSALPRGIQLTPSDGSFEIRSWSVARRLRLDVRRAGFVTPEPLEFEAPRVDWEIVLRRGGTIAGRITSARGHPRGLVGLRLARDDNTIARSSGTRWKPDGSFAIEGLDDGTYALSLASWGNLPGERTWSGIAVRAGETTTLEPIALDELVHVLRFDARDERGAPVTAALAWRRSTEDSFTDVPFIGAADGATLLHALELPVPFVQVRAPGFRALELADVRADQRVLLERGPSIELALAAGLPRLPENWVLRARLHDENGLERAQAVFDAAGRAHAALDGAGRYSVGLWLQHAAVRGQRGVNGLDWRIEVADSSAPQSFTSPPFTRELLDNLEILTR